MSDYTIIGGKLVNGMEILWTGNPPVGPEEIDAQVEKAKALDLPSLRAGVDIVPSNGRKLAVVGGGRSIIDHEDTLKNWDGDVWTINATYHWATARGIDSTFIACDPHVIVAQWAKNVKRALITTRCHPHVFDVLKESGADVRVFNLEGEGRVISGSSTATAAVHLSVMDGYKDITFFGVESSYPPGATHAYMHEQREAELIVSVDGELFHTAPDYLIQAVELSNLFRMVGEGGLKEESGGLLRALIRNPDFKTVWISEALYNGLKPKEEVAA